MKKHYIIDGYNVIHRIDALRTHLVQSLEKGRSALVSKLSAFQTQHRVAVTVVFDGDHMAAATSGSHGQVKVIYSRLPRKADDLIKRLIDDSHHKNDLVIVSSDMEVMHYAKASGCVTMSTEQFYQLMSVRKTETVEEGLETKSDPQLSQTEIRNWIDLFNRPESDEE